MDKGFFNMLINQFNLEENKKPLTIDADYSMSINESLKTDIIMKIESTAGLVIAQELISHERIDGIFMGPYDLSMSMGIPGEFDNLQFQEAIQKIRTSCNAQHKLFGTFAINATAATKEINDGCDIIAIGIDSYILIKSYQDILSEIKN